jgi:glycerophosphoryl diester phosphodiesterase
MKMQVTLLLFIFTIACSNKLMQHTNTTTKQDEGFDKQGHRGCRGLMPENTIPAMLHALDLNATTLELDVVITKDNQTESM